LTYSATDIEGCLIPIGGAEDKKSRRTILNYFTHLCGGKEARIVVIPVASAFAHETGNTYCKIFGDMGVSNVECLHVDSRQQANDPVRANLLREATGIFMTGGDQLKLMSVIGATRIEDAIHHCRANGTHIAGTSAGASAMSRQMIAFGRSGATPSQRMVQLASGLGLAESLIIDQHFSQRNRLGRLMTAVALNPGCIGVGIDEDTACVICPDGSAEVIGSGTVTIVDGREMAYTDVYSAKGYSPVTVSGVNVRVLRSGAQDYFG
jgi:cyanophycinase